jgi:hypothetical protein
MEASLPPQQEVATEEQVNNKGKDKEDQVAVVLEEAVVASSAQVIPVHYACSSGLWPIKLPGSYRWPFWAYSR